MSLEIMLLRAPLVCIDGTKITEITTIRVITTIREITTVRQLMKIKEITMATMITTIKAITTIIESAAIRGNGQEFGRSRCRLFDSEGVTQASN
jgi:hypothetical protein